MDLDRLNTGEKIAGVSAVLLFIFMFFDWFTAEFSGQVGSIGISASAGGSAWDALDYIPIILVITIVVALVSAFVRLAEADFEPPVSFNVVVTVLGALSFLLILYRIVSPPDLGVSGTGVDVSTEFGIFLGLVAAAGIAYGGYRGMQEEGTSFTDAADRLQGSGHQGAAPPPPPPPPPAQTPPPPPPPPSGQNPPPPPPPPPAAGS